MWTLIISILFYGLGCWIALMRIRGAEEDGYNKDFSMEASAILSWITFITFILIYLSIEENTKFFKLRKNYEKTSTNT